MGHSTRTLLSQAGLFRSTKHLRSATVIRLPFLEIRKRPTLFLVIRYETEQLRKRQMNTDFEDQYLDVLQNIECSLLSEIEIYPDLCDHDMLRIIEGAIAQYKSQNKVKFGSSLNPIHQKILEGVTAVCDWRL